MSLGDLKEVKIIILSTSVFQEAEYKSQVCHLSDRKDVEPLSVLGLSGRELESFYRTVIESSRFLVQSYQRETRRGTPDSEALEKANQALRNALKTSKDGMEAIKPAKQSRRKTANSKKPPRATDDVRGTSAPRRKQRSEDIAWSTTWLHNFSFARIIWDEFSYENERAGLFFETAMANAKWLLSATPPMTGLGDICNIAKKFNVHIARPEPQMMPGLPITAQGPVLSHTSKSEDFRSFSSPVRSIDLALHRDMQARSFLRSYCRANLIEGSDMAVKETIVCRDMSALDAVRYFAALSETLDSNWDYSLLPPNIRSLAPISGKERRERSDNDLSMSLLIQLASGLRAQEGTSSETLKKKFSDKVRGMEHQFKMLFDKLMWLRECLRSLLTAVAARQEGYTSALNHANSWANRILGEHTTEEEYRKHGGKEAFMHHRDILTAGSPRPHEDSRLQWALYTWIDFYHLEAKDLGAIAKGGLSVDELARDLIILKYKSRVKDSQGTERDQTEHDILRADEREKAWTIPSGIELLVRDNSILPNNATEKKNFFATWLAAKPPKPKCPGTALLPKGGKKAEAQERLLEHNIAFKDSFPLPKLRELLWYHENGHHDILAYFDGRPAVNPHEPFPVPKGDKPWEPIAAEIKKTTSQLTQLLEDKVATSRELQFIKKVLALSDSTLASAGQAQGQQRQECDHCKALLSSDQFAFLVVSCGHSLCLNCRRHLDSECPVADCNAFTLERPILPYSTINFTQDAPTKAKQIGELIKTEIPNNDHVIVFAQYQNMLSALRDEFRKLGIVFTDLTKSSASEANNVATLLEEYKELKGGRVLLLDIESDTSAGSNITVANHVIFTTPFYHQDSDHRERTIQQAVGRCVRRGQKKAVTIYHFMVRNSVEEKMLRDRVAWEDAQMRAGTMTTAKSREPFRNVFTRCVTKLPYWMYGAVCESAQVDDRDGRAPDAANGLGNRPAEESGDMEICEET
ncbi:hypothetical protein OQA88_9799 [Cercophora sp. LCS_1]